MGTICIPMDYIGNYSRWWRTRFFSWLLSMRHDGASVSELTGMYLGSLVKQIMRVFSVILLVMVGAVFAVGPASLIAMLIGKQELLQDFL